MVTMIQTAEDWRTPQLAPSFLLFVLLPPSSSSSSSFLISGAHPPPALFLARETFFFFHTPLGGGGGERGREGEGCPLYFARLFSLSLGALDFSFFVPHARPFVSGAQRLRRTFWVTEKIQSGPNALDPCGISKSAVRH